MWHCLNSILYFVIVTVWNMKVDKMLKCVSSLSVQCQFTPNSMLRGTRSNFKLKLAHYFTLSCLFFPKLLHLVVAHLTLQV